MTKMFLPIFKNVLCGENVMFLIATAILCATIGKVYLPKKQCRLEWVSDTSPTKMADYLLSTFDSCHFGQGCRAHPQIALLVFFNLTVQTRYHNQWWLVVHTLGRAHTQGGPHPLERTGVRVKI